MNIGTEGWVRPLRAAALVCVIAAAGLSAGCISVTARGYDVEDTSVYATPLEFEDIVERSQGLKLGMGKDEAVALFPPRTRSLRASASVEGVPAEEWRIEVAERRSGGKVTRAFRRYLYFYDGKLVEFSTRQVNWDNPGVRESWARLSWD